MTRSEQPPPSQAPWPEEIRSFSGIAIACILSEEEVFSAASKAWMNRFRYTDAELREKTLPDLIIPDLPPGDAAFLRRTVPEEQYGIQHTFLRSDGSAFQGYLETVPVVDPQGRRIAQAFILSGRSSENDPFQAVGNSGHRLISLQKILLDVLSALPHLRQEGDLFRTVCQIIAGWDHISMVAVVNAEIPVPWNNPLARFGRTPFSPPVVFDDSSGPWNVTLCHEEKDERSPKHLFTCLLFALPHNRSSGTHLVLASQGPGLLHPEERLLFRLLRKFCG